MTVTQEEKDKAFREWKKEIDKRCAEHVEKYPEHKPIKPAGLTIETVREAVKQIRGTMARPAANQPEEDRPTKVEVRESTFNTGRWVVLVDGELKESFGGPLAHLNATKYASDVLNGISKGNDRGISSGLPDPCIHCGNRFSHRSDCPDRGRAF